MLTLKMLRDDPEKVIERLAVKNFDARQIVYEIIDLDTAAVSRPKATPYFPTRRRCPQRSDSS